MGSPPLFTDKTVVITGSAGGLGLEMGRRFAEADAVVVLTDVDAELGRRAAESLCTQGARAQYEMLDVRIPGQSVDLVDRLVEEYGTIDVWVNNAGVAHKGPAEVLPADQWRETIDVMLSGAFYCSQAVSGPMLARGDGRHRQHCFGNRLQPDRGPRGLRHCQSRPHDADRVSGHRMGETRCPRRRRRARCRHDGYGAQGPRGGHRHRRSLRTPDAHAPARNAGRNRRRRTLPGQ